MSRPHPRTGAGATPRSFYPPDFVQTSVAPVAAFTGVLAGPAAVGGRWTLLAAIAGVAPVAIVILWALATERAGRRGMPIHPLAQAVALGVLLGGIAVGVAVCVMTVVAPDLLGLHSGGVR